MVNKGPSGGATKNIFDSCPNQARNALLLVTSLYTGFFYLRVVIHSIELVSHTIMFDQHAYVQLKQCVSHCFKAQPMFLMISSGGRVSTTRTKIQTLR